MAPDAGIASGAGEVLVSLRDPEASDPTLAGAKAAALARAAAGGLPVLDGWVLTTRAQPADVAHAAGRIWAEHRGQGPLVVRSSSTVEDGSSHSMAGLFRSVAGVESEDALVAAVGEVLASADTAARGILPLAGGREAMAVLIQPQLPPAPGGVLFGLDPVSGRADRLAVVVDAQGPAGVVAGETGRHGFLTRRGRRLGRRPHIIGPQEARQLARIAADARAVFGGPQDIEWGTDADGRIWLLQSRPVTAAGQAAPSRTRSPVLGPGSLAETFPDPLAPLESELWVGPLSEAVASAVTITGAVPRRRARGPVVVTVGGRVAGDLDLLAAPAEAGGLRRWVDPSRWFRRLLAAWRVGRLRAALPGLASDLLARADADLAAVGSLDQMADEHLVRLIERTRPRLVSLHGHEVLMGLLVRPGQSGPTGASVALGLLARSRSQGLDDPEAIALHPTVLALVPPRIGLPPPLPQGGDEVAGSERQPEGESWDDPHELREALRLRARWFQELGARAASELGRRLSAAGVLPDAAWVRWMTLRELADAARSRRAPADLARRVAGGFGPALPERFRLDARGRPVPVAARTGDAGAPGGTPAGGGRGQGTVHQGDDPPPPGQVWVVASLDPGLAPWLPRLGGLVAETGTPLSHLAILARELSVPTVVGVTGARERFPAGTVVVVDGHSGEVAAIARPESPRGHSPRQQGPGAAARSIGKRKGHGRAKRGAAWACAGWPAPQPWWVWRGRACTSSCTCTGGSGTGRSWPASCSWPPSWASASWW